MGGRPRTKGNRGAAAASAATKDSNTPFVATVTRGVFFHMKKGRFTTRQLALNAMLMAMCTVLASVALKLGGNFKLTFESVPIHIGALLFGPVDGMLIGGLGTFIYQALFSGYGINATTLLWILPYVVCGLSVGAYARRRHFVLNRRQTTFIMLVSELAITLLNTFALYVDSHIFGYYSAAFVFGTLSVRLALCVAKGIVYGSIMQSLIRPLRRTVA